MREFESIEDLCNELTEISTSIGCTLFCDGLSTQGEINYMCGRDFLNIAIQNFKLADEGRRDTCEDQ